VQRIISLQYNPEKLTRSLQVNASGGEAVDRSEAMRFNGLAVEIMQLEADIDAVHQLSLPGSPGTTLEHNNESLRRPSQDHKAEPSKSKLALADAERWGRA
jgi:hypothetical protein